MIDNQTAEALIKKAELARQNAYCRYSKFSVGAALLCKNGNIYTGANIENSSFGATICAERAALSAAISQGEREFSAIAIVGGDDSDASPKACYPCGICRQFLSEFCSEDTVVVLRDCDKTLELTLGSLIPNGFIF